MRKLRFKKPSPALVIAVIALFVGLSGGAYAANKIGTNQIKGKAVTTGKLAGKAVTTGKLAGKSVKTGKLAGQAVTESKLGDQSVTSSKLGDGSVTSSKLSDESVKSDELGRINTRTEDTTIAPQTNGTVSVSCESDEKVVSGGWEGPPMVPNATIYLVSADKKDSEGWTASALNFGTAPIQLEVHAYCLESSS
jgi:hypothetical protein